MKNVSLIHITPLLLSLFVLFCLPVPASDLEQVKTSDQKQDDKAFYKGHWYSRIDNIMEYLHYDLSVETTTQSWKLLATYNPEKSHIFSKENSREKLSKTVKYSSFYFQQNLDGSRLTAFPNTDYNPRIEAFYLNEHIVNQEKYLDISKSVMSFLAGAGNTPNDTVIIFDTPDNQFPAECQFIIQQIAKYTEKSMKYMQVEFDDPKIPFKILEGNGTHLPFNILNEPGWTMDETQNNLSHFSGIRGKIHRRHGDIFCGLYQKINDHVINDHVFIDPTSTFIKPDHISHTYSLICVKVKAQTGFSLELPDSPGESIDDSLKQILENNHFKSYTVLTSGTNSQPSINDFDSKSVLKLIQ